MTVLGRYEALVFVRQVGSGLPRVIAYDEASLDDPTIFA